MFCRDLVCVLLVIWPSLRPFICNVFDFFYCIHYCKDSDFFFIKYKLDIAQGMLFLSEKGFIHRVKT